MVESNTKNQFLKKQKLIAMKKLQLVRRLKKITQNHRL